MAENDIIKHRTLESENEKQVQVIEELRFENQNLIKQLSSLKSDNENIKVRYDDLNTKFQTVESEFERIKNKFDLKNNPGHSEVKESLENTEAVSTILEWED